MIELLVDGEVRRFAVDRVINGGYSGRDEAAVLAHVEELEAEGVPAPDAVPAFYELAPNVVLVDPGSVRVVGERTSGEAEFGLVLAGEERFVVAASDQTDRALETESIQLSKQVAPNVLSPSAWRYGSVADHWDELELRAWNTVDGEREPYQEATLGELLRPDGIVEEMIDRFPDAGPGTLLLSGTVPTASGEIRPGSRFEVELHDPVANRTLSVGYDVVPI